jgi:tRNA(Ile2) C34 agmatinyltransferase TiaS
VDALASPFVRVLGLIAVAIVVLRIVNRYYQRCPHCRRWVRRAHRGWLRCKSCGRQYHRSVQFRR